MILGLNGQQSDKILEKHFGKLSVNSWPTNGQQSADKWPTVGRQTANSQPTVG